MPKLNVSELSKSLGDVGARWKATDNITERALGYIPGPTEHSLEAREMLSNAAHRHFRAMVALAPPPYPSSVDWRAHNGQNFVTPVKDQGSCGSCVAFGSCATVEANVQIKKNNPTLGINLSEAHLFYCHVNGIPHGTCGTGWWPDAAMNVFQQRGVVDEKCFPYTPGDQPCHVCKDWQNRVTKIAKWHKVTTPSDMKLWLAKHGPLATCFSVYQDFFAYHSGVYHHVSGGLAGGHCVSCVGYNDAGRYWICKNSWGTGWGDHGFFLIAYGQCGIDATMWAVEP